MCMSSCPMASSCRLRPEPASSRRRYRCEECWRPSPRHRPAPCTAPVFGGSEPWSPERPTGGGLAGPPGPGGRDRDGAEVSPVGAGGAAVPEVGSPLRGARGARGRERGCGRPPRKGAARALHCPRSGVSVPLVAGRRPPRLHPLQAAVAVRVARCAAAARGARNQACERAVAARRQTDAVPRGVRTYIAPASARGARAATYVCLATGRALESVACAPASTTSGVHSAGRLCGW